jgi:hypothetical protein
MQNEKLLSSAELYRVRHTQLGDTGTVIATATADPRWVKTDDQSATCAG